MKRPEEAKGWGMRVGGYIPHLAYYFAPTKAQIQECCTESYHSPVRVAIITTRELAQLRRAAKGGAK